MGLGGSACVTACLIPESDKPRAGSVDETLVYRPGPQTVDRTDWSPVLSSPVCRMGGITVLL